MSGRPTEDDTARYVDAFAADVDVDVDVDAAWARFEAEVTPARRARPLWPWFAAAGALAAALLLAWMSMPSRTVDALSEEAGHQARDEAHGQTETAAVAPLASPGRGVVRPEPPAPTPAVTPEPEPTPAPTGATEDARPRRRRGERVEDPRPEAGSPSGLAEELRLLEALRKAGAAGRHADVLARVREHARRFPGGAFAAERELARVRALCGLGRLEALRKAKAEFAAAFPASHLGSLVRDACREVPRSDHDG